MRTRRWLTWLVFAVCALAVVEGLGWVTWQALRLERREMEARAESRFQESIRLALWRMESELTPLVAHEAARPYFHYWPFYPAERAYTRMWQEVQPGEVLVPSPLLDSSGQYIRLHFQMSPDGQITSPQAPSGNMRDLAESQYVGSEFIVLAGHMLDELSAMVRTLPTTEQWTRRADDLAYQFAGGPQDRGGQYGDAVQTLESGEPQSPATKEYAARMQAALNANIPYESRKGQKLAGPAETPASPLRAEPERQAASGLPAPAAPMPPVGAPPPPAAAATSDATNRYSDFLQKQTAPGAPRVKDEQGPGRSPAPIDVEQGPLQPVWCTNPATGEPELLLRRSVRIQGRHSTQGFWVDWPALRARLLSVGSDMVPDASLTPVLGSATESDAPSARRLATIPVLLTPGPVPAVAAPAFTPTHTTLAVTWLAVIAAIVAIGIVLRTAMELGDRRGRFVSAVTHDLRTPLTTFCLYTEMLADGMVKDDTARREYLSTLKTESRRLAGIVENVLDYARLGGARRTNGHTPIPASDLLSQVRPSLERRAAQSAMDLQFESGDLSGHTVTVDPPTFERILLNLVDNACKYAAGSADCRLHIEAAILLGRRPILEVKVRDHGPGIPDRDRRRVFLPFHRSRRDADGPQSGLGLGLALARGLARGLGGDLALGREGSHGAEFRLTLPAQTRP